MHQGNHSRPVRSTFRDNIFRLHGTPSVIISDRDPRFTNHFWKQFFQILGKDLRLSTAFHPQTDGQSEVTICVLENFLRPYVEVHPPTWNKFLSLAEFAANNAMNASTGFSPFVLNAREPPTLPELLVVSHSSATNQAVADVLSTMKKALEIAQHNLAQAQQKTKQQVDKARRAEEWKKGDQVLLSTRHLRTLLRIYH